MPTARETISRKWPPEAPFFGETEPGLEWPGFFYAETPSALREINRPPIGSEPNVSLSD